MEEENRVYRRSISFIISVPDTKIESDIQSLVLRLNDLRLYLNMHMEDIEYLETEWWNKTIEEMQGILEIIKVKEVNKNEIK